MFKWCVVELFAVHGLLATPQVWHVYIHNVQCIIILFDVQVVCPNEECDKEMKFEELKQHFGECDHSRAVCQLCDVCYV